MLFEKEGVARVDFTDPKVTRQVQILLKSFERSVGRKMLPDMPQGLTQEEQARYMFLEAPFIISHDRVQLDDGTFDNNYNFANLSALDFFEISYDALTKTPSSSTTETVSDEQRERNQLLGDALVHGNAVYTGIRYSTTGKRILMTDGILFTLADERGIYAGQAVLVENIDIIPPDVPTPTVSDVTVAEKELSVE